MDYSVEVRQRFAAALAGERHRPGDVRAENRVLAAGTAEDRTLGVWARARICVSDGRIVAAAFDVWGCPDTVAAADLAAEQMCGMQLADFGGLGPRRLAELLDIPKEKLGKLLRLEDAALAAVAEAREQTEKGIDDGSITD